VSASYELSKNVFGALRGMARQQLREFCELCQLPLADPHPHLLQTSNLEILCSCEACAVLFSHRGENGKFLRIPRDPQHLTGFLISDAEWSALRLPIDLAFFVHRSSEGRTTAYYPSPAGCTESLLDLDAWAGLIERNSVLAQMTPDVEALLVNRTRGRRDYFIAPIDQCYMLAGLIRRHWRGLSGGDEVWHAIDEFFEALGARATRKDSAHA
jgi:Family of unknown function (DUF5947)